MSWVHLIWEMVPKEGWVEKEESWGGTFVPRHPQPLSQSVIRGLCFLKINIPAPSPSPWLELLSGVVPQVFHIC